MTTIVRFFAGDRQVAAEPLCELLCTNEEPLLAAIDRVDLIDLSTIGELNTQTTTPPGPVSTPTQNG